MSGEKEQNAGDLDGAIRKQALFSAAHQAYRDCRYYPCHTFPDGQEHLNCLFCYCPFYPCGNAAGSGKWIKGKDGKRIWDCSACIMVHRDDVSARILELLVKKYSMNRIKKIIRREFQKPDRL